MDLSVILVNYNTKDLLRNCLRSVFETVTDASYEVFVVDNASADGSVEMLKREFPSVRVIANERNVGFAAANNQAMKEMNGRYALLLNSDAVLTGQAVSDLMTFMEGNAGSAMACGQLLNADGSKQNSIANFPDYLSLMFNVPVLEYLFPKRYPSKRFHHSSPIEIDSGIGACLMVRKKAIDEIGLLDERYFFFFEETDWAFRFRKSGWKIHFVPSARIYHLQGKSIGQSARSRIEFYRSRYQYFRKWSRFYPLAFTIIFFRLAVNWFFTTGAALFTFGLNRQLVDKGLVYSQLLVWHLKKCPPAREN